MAATSERYSVALRAITGARTGWRAFGWLQLALSGLSDSESRLLKREFDKVARERQWTHRAKLAVPVDPRFNAMVGDAMTQAMPERVNLSEFLEGFTSVE